MSKEPEVKDEISIEDLPDEIQESLRIISGADIGLPDGSMDENPFTGIDESSINDKQSTILKSFGNDREQAQEKFKETAQERFIKNSDKREEKIKIGNHSVKVLDLAQQDEANEYARLCDLAGNGDGWTMQSSSITPMQDSNAPRGFRTLVTVKMYKIQKDTIVTTPEFTVVSSSTIK